MMYMAQMMKTRNASKNHEEGHLIHWTADWIIILLSCMTASGGWICSAICLCLRRYIPAVQLAVVVEDEWVEGEADAQSPLHHSIAAMLPHLPDCSAPLEHGSQWCDSLYCSVLGLGCCGSLGAALSRQWRSGPVYLTVKMHQGENMKILFTVKNYGRFHSSYSANVDYIAGRKAAAMQRLRDGWIYHGHFWVTAW